MVGTIGRALGQKHRLQVRRMGEFLDYLASQVRQAFSLLYVMEAVTFLLVLFGIADTLAAGVMERSRQFGTMRAVGLSRARLCQMVLIEGASLGLLGTTLALAIGLVLSVFWVHVQFPALLGWNLELQLPIPFILAGGLLSVLLAVVGALGPSLRAARLAVPAALREE
jgi:putative ABC transport system permease protein